MRIFIGWSGERSRIVALALRNWLRTVNPSFQAWMSEEDIAKGARWNPELDKELDAANVGILCLTRENLLERYIHYEAGALAKRVAESRVFTYLIGLEPNDVSGPLASFQHTKAHRQGTQKLLEQLNGLLEEDRRHEPGTLQPAFNRNWGDLDSEIQQALRQPTPETTGPVRGDREVLDEILTTVRELAKRVEPPSSTVFPYLPSSLLPDRPSLGALLAGAASGLTQEQVEAIWRIAAQTRVMEPRIEPRGAAKTPVRPDVLPPIPGTVEPLRGEDDQGRDY